MMTHVAKHTNPAAKAAIIAQPKENDMSIPINAATKKAYRGDNKEILVNVALALDFTTPEWATLKQWNSLNRSVAKDEKGAAITFFETLETVDGTTYRSPVTAFVYNRSQLKRPKTNTSHAE